MAFTVGAVAAKDGAGTTVGGGLLAADIAGSNVGPWFLYHSLVDGVAGVNKLNITSGNALKVDGSAVTQPISDAAGTLTVDAPVGTPVFVRLSDGTSAITTLPVSLASVPSHAVTNAGTFATQDSQYVTEDAVAAANPIGPPLMAVRRDTLTIAEVSADGDNIAVKATNKGQLHVLAAIDTTQLSPLGQAVMAASAPVVVASDQSAISTKGSQVTCSTDITRPADVLPYAINDAWADSTTVPTAGGFTLTGAARASGGSGVITDIYFCSSAVPGTLLQGELHIFDSAATAVNDNAAWNLSDADAKLRVAIVPFTLVADANNSYHHVQNLNIGFTCVGTANLRYLVKVKNAYTPTSAEVLTVRAKIIQTN